MLSYKDGDIREQILARTGGRGADAVFVCGGNDDTFREAVDMVRYGIGRVVNLKHYPGDGDIGIPKFPAAEAWRERPSIWSSARAEGRVWSGFCAS